MDLLGEASRTWNVAIHWLYTVCNPKIKKRSNPKYSPVYEEHATQLPLNRFGELDHMVTDEQGNLIRAAISWLVMIALLVRDVKTMALLGMTMVISLNVIPIIIQL